MYARLLVRRKSTSLFHYLQKESITYKALRQVSSFKLEFMIKLLKENDKAAMNLFQIMIYKCYYQFTAGYRPRLPQWI